VSLRAHLLVLVVTACTLLFILHLVRRHRLRAKYSVLWMSLGVALATLAIAPGLLEAFSDLVGIRTPALGFLLLALTFLLVLSLHFSWELSRLEDRTRELAEEHALLSEFCHRLLEGGPTRRSGLAKAPDDDQSISDERASQTPHPALEPLDHDTEGVEDSRAT
jgi:hypothetical protein